MQQVHKYIHTKSKRWLKSKIMSDNCSCRLCSAKVEHAFTARVMRKYSADYMVCNHCGLLQVCDPDWLDEAYDESINVSDTGIMQRNIDSRDLTLILLMYLYGFRGADGKRFLDYGGGYGIFVRLMRDAGFDFYWHDAFSENLVARGFEDKGESYDAIVAFEVIEHLTNPNDVLDNIFARTDTLIFSTSLYGSEPPQANDWYYYGLDHGQHISFFNLKTLEYIAQDRGLYLASDGYDFHILSRRRVPGKIVRIARKFQRLGGARVLKLFLKSKTVEDSLKLGADA